jgi:diguanylate cyclase (GGDEF)-like protein/PAS domain S-box-containing protein
MPDGTPARVIGTDSDITELKKVEAALAEERETLRVTLESIADGVIAADPEGKVMFMNSVAAQMTGWPTEAALGQPVEDVYRLADETGTPLANPVVDCLFGRRRRQVDEDAVLLKREGGRSDVRSSVSLIEAPGGGFFGAVLVFQDVSRSRALQRELAHTAMHDGLTGLPNRSAFERKLDEMRLQARGDGRVHALCFIDLDRFKPVNDKAGHAAGDALLREVAVTLRGRARRTDFAARIGGDEFAVLLADCDVNAASRIAGGIVEAISAIAFQWEGETYRIGASVGVTLVGPDAPDPSRLLAEADAACYAAKAKGRNRVEISETWASS